ncbi:polyphosphate kinase 2 family protein [Mariniblastus fucicola]|uniref:Polyphosphate kinase 2 (PPK2) n=1 Tax=Mariniblastus fucicola TaxID=980251 RepID=A0A5B9P8N9_9BACT|nr:polyphosphate kinase 2 family protein [Mariniblastus fucicola]QEG22724.1 Polyphosphate kinase 2 (PPK2) [Mariniblastus fucicola]
MSRFDIALPHTFKHGESIKLKDFSSGPPEDIGFGKKAAHKRIGLNAVEMAEMAKRLYAENRRSILLVLQGMDTAGKDGTIRWVMRGMNPTSCQVTSFKRPSEIELDHDFLWRCHKAVPRKGNIGIFNRSHYEDVLVVRVHSLVPESVWSERYEQINDFEKLLSSTGTTIVKCFLHISKETQRERLQERIDVTEKHWKFNPGDLKERKLWSEYQQAYEAALSKCNSEHSPWYIIPSDKKWYRNLVISQLLKRVLEDLDPQFPEAEEDFRGLVVE